MMPLTCECDDYDVEHWFEPDDDFSVYDRQRGQRCRSCGKMIRKGDEVLRFKNWRYPKNEIEERFHGDEVPLADRYLCERCGGLYFALTEPPYNYCGVSYEENLVELAHEAGKIAKEAQSITSAPFPCGRATENRQ